MASIFSVDSDTKENKEMGVLYMRGPVKRLERCYAKCQSDYRFVFAKLCAVTKSHNDRFVLNQ